MRLFALFSIVVLQLFFGPTTHAQLKYARVDTLTDALVNKYSCKFCTIFAKKLEMITPIFSALIRNTSSNSATWRTWMKSCLSSSRPSPPSTPEIRPCPRWKSPSRNSNSTRNSPFLENLTPQRSRRWTRPDAEIRILFKSTGKILAWGICWGGKNATWRGHFSGKRESWLIASQNFRRRISHPKWRCERSTGLSNFGETLRIYIS